MASESPTSATIATNVESVTAATDAETSAVAAITTAPIDSSTAQMDNEVSQINENKESEKSPDYTTSNTQVCIKICFVIQQFANLLFVFQI